MTRHVQRPIYSYNIALLGSSIYDTVLCIHRLLARYIIPYSLQVDVSKRHARVVSLTDNNPRVVLSATLKSFLRCSLRHLASKINNVFRKQSKEQLWLSR